MANNNHTLGGDNHAPSRGRALAANVAPTAMMVNKAPANEAGRVGEIVSPLPTNHRLSDTPFGKMPIDYSKLVASKRKSKGEKDGVVPKPDRKRARGETGNVATLNRLSGLVDSCVVANHAELEEAYDSLRDYLHALEHLALNINAINASHALTDRGLKRCFNGQEHDFPVDIRNDAQMLYNRWRVRDTDCDIMRGLELSGAEGRRSLKLVTEYGPFKTQGAFHGERHLFNGMWWPCQLAALRDGAHGHSVKGISGSTTEGAYSIVISGSEYEDVDQGDEVGYTGTRSTKGTPTRDTECMKASLLTRNPVRVLRTSKLGQHNDFRPDEGYRYDGLYTVVDEECLDHSTHHWRFHLRRNPGQGSIRNQGKAKRPTKNDLEAYWKHQKLSK